MDDIQGSQFLEIEDRNISKEYLEKGFIIGPAANQETLTWIRKSFIGIVKKELGINNNIDTEDFLDLIHQKIDISTLNDFRLSMISKVNALPGFKQMYYEVAKPYLDSIVGNELAMQSKVNLSIQLPNDNSSLLPVHADTWSGDSPFEVVVWIPLVNCYKTKSMFILPPKESMKLNKNFAILSGENSEDLFNSIEKKVNWIEIDYGSILLFNQSLPHGNRVNMENETRWTMNCRFKGLFTPYKDKKIGEFFEPITLRAASVSGLNYQFPELK
jgi:sporadic carbohydrate cluster 2OG-Fe(II) oxygenase